MKKIKILDTALDDLEAGKEFYNLQSPGIGEYFLDTLISEIDSLTLYAGIHPIKHNFYQMLSKRFPYAIYYDFIDDKVFVFRVLDCRENPRKRDKKLLG